MSFVEFASVFGNWLLISRLITRPSKWCNHLTKVVVQGKVSISHAHLWGPSLATGEQWVVCLWLNNSRFITEARLAYYMKSCKQCALRFHILIALARLVQLRNSASFKTPLVQWHQERVTAHCRSQMHKLPWNHHNGEGTSLLLCWTINKEGIDIFWCKIAIFSKVFRHSFSGEKFEFIWVYLNWSENIRSKDYPQHSKHK